MSRTGHPKPHVAAFIALSRQRHKVIYKLMTTDARYDREVLFSQHLDRLEREPHAHDMDHEPVEEKLAS